MKNSLPNKAVDLFRSSGRIPWLITVVATGIVLALTLLPPLLPPSVRAVIMAGFSAVCHQLPERTLHVHLVPLAVCSRCLGIYAGLVLGSLATPLLLRWEEFLWKRTGIILVVALAVPIVDWLGGVFGLWDSGHPGRFLTGAVFGLVSGYFLARAAIFTSRKRSAESA